MTWKTLKSNPYFTAAESAAVGSFGTWLYGWVSSGAPWPVNWKAVGIIVLGAVLTNLRNLYKQSPNATVTSSVTVETTTPVAPGQKEAQSNGNSPIAN